MSSDSDTESTATTQDIPKKWDNLLGKTLVKPLPPKIELKRKPPVPEVAKATNKRRIPSPPPERKKAPLYSHEDIASFMDRKKKEKQLKEKQELEAKKKEKERYQLFLASLEKKQQQLPKKNEENEEEKKNKIIIKNKVRKIIEEPRKIIEEPRKIEEHHTASFYMSEHASSAPSSPPTLKKETPKR